MKKYLLIVLLLLCSCAGRLKQEVNFNPSEPIRVAIIPFYQVEDGKLIPETFDSNILIDNIPLLSSKLKESPASSVQTVVDSEMRKTGLDLISQGYVNSQLGHHAFVIEGVVQAANLLAADPRVLGAFLGADALLFGKVTKWDRSYYGVQSVSTVALELKLVSASDGKILFTSDGEDSDSRGLTKIPTGFSSLVLEPIRGLDNEIIVDLSQKLVKNMLKPLYVMERPEYVNSSGPALFGAVHNAREAVTPTRPLVVAALGTPAEEGYFVVGSAGSKVPMYEVEPGHYIGRFIPIEGEKYDVDEVTVSLRDHFGRTVEKTILGAVAIDGDN